MNLQKLILILIILTCGTILNSQNLSVQYKCGNTNLSVQSITPILDILNNSSVSVSLSSLKIRYYYSREGASQEQFNCDFAQFPKEYVSGAFYNGYVEISFSQAAGNVPSYGSSGEIQTRFNKTDWSYYDQSNDYSFDPSKISLASWNKVTLYQNGSLVWGAPNPAAEGTQGPTIAPTPPGETAAPTQTPTAPPPTQPPQGGGDDWLHTQGNNILDMNGRVVRLTGTNWFGYNTQTYVFDGLWTCDLKNSIAQMAQRGFNVLRIPIATELVHNWSQGIYPISTNITTYGVNTYLAGKNSLEVFEITLAELKLHGMKAIIDMHSPESDDQGHMYALWYKDAITTAVFDSAWEWIANRYKNDDTIIGCDLKNEPHGVSWTPGLYAKWDTSNDENNWKRAAEVVAGKILARNPNLLILVEGIESFPIDGVTWSSQNQNDYYNSWWGGNLRGVAAMPISLGANQNKVVYAPHEYGPNVYVQTWFYPGFNKQTLYTDCWYPNWYFIVEEGTAPMFIGEWGGKLDNGDNEIWITAFRDFIVEKNLHFTFWCFNANSTDTGGLVQGDWVTWDEEKYNFVKPTLWRDSAGKFVSLDHAIPLYSPSSGTTIADYYTSGNPAPSADPAGTPAPTPQNGTPTPAVTQAPTPGTSEAPTPFVTQAPTPSSTQAPTPVASDAPTPSVTQAPTTTPYGQSGDVNENGVVDIVDALLVAQYSVGNPVSNFNPTVADVTRDGRIDIIDALRIAQYFVGIIPSF